MSSATRYFHTLRHLRPIQVAGRVWHRLYRPQPDLRVAPRRRSPVREYVEPCLPQPSLSGPDSFRLLNVERRCGSPGDWQPPGADLLWIYNLHYFDDLNACDARLRAPLHVRLLERWVAENPPAQGVGWDPYPASRRIVNWVKWTVRGGELPARCHESLAVQARFLLGRLEYHLLGNHLLANAKALMYAGAYFEGPEAERWFARGLAIATRQMREQVLADGGHFELSTMYHAAVLEDLLDLINLCAAFGRPVAADWEPLAQHMHRWLLTMSHPDGGIAFFNDAAFGIAPDAQALAEYCLRLGLSPGQSATDSLVVLAASGYVRAAAGDACMLCDCAAVGPDHLPGHAHADTLSFELSLGDQRVFVNSGTSLYGGGEERNRQRGSAAHNTVIVDEMNSSEVWGAFRVARRARARIHSIAARPFPVIEASHDGYLRLHGRNIHSRRWMLDRDSLRIEDRVTGRFERAQARFHLHPNVDARIADHHCVELTMSNGARMRMNFDGAEAVAVDSGSWHPRFGMAVANRCVVAQFRRDSLTTRMQWVSLS